MFIVNVRPQAMPVQHWLLIFVNPEIVHFIDSYRMPPDFYQLREKLHTFRRRLLINKVSVRGLESKLHCLFFSYRVLRNFSLHKILSK